MRRTPLRLGLTAIAFALPGAGGALSACSSSSSSTPPANDASVSDTGPLVDASVDTAAVDQSAPDTGAATSDASDGSASLDAGEDTGTGSVVLDFGLDAAADCAVGSVGEPTDLACTGLYSDWASKTVSTAAVEYAPGIVFWSDGADKTRWIALPPGTQIDTSNMDEWTFPVGTRVWKEFRLALRDASTPTRVETRLLWKVDPNTWYRTTYAWSADGETSATELTSGELDAGGIGYEIPQQSYCDVCHRGRLDGVLGFEAIALSAPGATGLPMATLESKGWLTAPPAQTLTVPGDATESAALGWLHMNCGTACHNRNLIATAQSTSFYMRLNAASLGSVQATDTYTTGWNTPTVDYDIPGFTGTTYRLHACDTATSAVYYRADHRDEVDGVQDGTQMPPIDSHVVDTSDVAKVAAWIEEGCDAGSDQ